MKRSIIIKSCGVILDISESEDSFDRKTSKFFLDKFLFNNKLKGSFIRMIYGYDNEIIIHCQMEMSDVRDFKLSHII